MGRWLSLKKIVLFALVVVFIVGFFSYRSVLENSSNSMTKISITEKGPLKEEPEFKGFELGKMSPGRTKSKVLRIENKLDNEVLVKNLHIKLRLLKDGNLLNMDSKPATNYLDNMKVKVEFEAPSGSDRRNLFEGNFKEFSDGIDCRISVPKGHSVDVFYTILMDESANSDVAGIECDANLTAKVAKLDLEGKDKRLTNIITDISGHWAFDCIKSLITRGIIKGYPDGSVKPSNNITRAEAAVIIAKATNFNPTGKKISFKDSIPDWAQDYVAELVYEGVFTGYPDGRFLPNEFISRQEAACAIVKALGSGGLDEELKFKDAENIGDWAKSWIKTGIDRNIISGYPDNTFRPKEKITRAEVITIICKAEGFHDDHNK